MKKQPQRKFISVASLAERVAAQIPLMASLQAHRELEARVVALEKKRKHKPHEFTQPTPPEAPEGYEHLNPPQRRIVLKDEWYITENINPGEASKGPVSRNRWIIRKKEKNKISVELTKKEWEKILQARETQWGWMMQRIIREQVERQNK